MSSTSLVRTALAVLNASAAGAPVDAGDVLRLRRAAGPDTADWAVDILAAHVLSVELRRAGKGVSAGACQ